VPVTRIGQRTDTVFTNLFGLQTGLVGFALATNEFTPGPQGHAESFGGFILDPRADGIADVFGGRGRRQLWHGGGALHYTQKFPTGGLFYQTRGLPWPRRITRAC